MAILADIALCRARLAQGETGCLVRVAGTRGSAPRRAGAWMAVFAQALVGTIGGGRLEYEALLEARAWLAQGAPAGALPGTRDVPLGPSLGQCCGGRVALAFEPLALARLSELEQAALAGLVPVGLFGGGHVGRALVDVLVGLPFDVHWMDSRDDVFGLSAADAAVAAMPPNLHCEFSDPVEAGVGHLPPGSHVLVMSYSHAEDFEVVMACLDRRRRRADLPFVGLIGSRSKWATFAGRLRRRGYSEEEIAGVTCPIGVAGIQGKEPEVIAVAVAAQLLQAISGSVPAAG